MVLENKISFDERNGRQFEPCKRMDTLPRLRQQNP